MIKLHELKVKIFGKSRDELIEDMQNGCRDIINILENVEIAVDELIESHQEYMRILLIVQDKCQIICDMMDKNEKVPVDIIKDATIQGDLPHKTKTLEDILESCDRIDKIIEGYGNGDSNGR